MYWFVFCVYVFIVFMLPFAVVKTNWLIKGHSNEVVVSYRFIACVVPALGTTLHRASSVWDARLKISIDYWWMTPTLGLSIVRPSLCTSSCAAMLKVCMCLCVYTQAFPTITHSLWWCCRQCFASVTTDPSFSTAQSRHVCIYTGKMVTSHLGDKPTGRKSTGRHTSWPTRVAQLVVAQLVYRPVDHTPETSFSPSQ